MYTNYNIFFSSLFNCFVAFSNEDVPRSAIYCHTCYWYTFYFADSHEHLGCQLILYILAKTMDSLFFPLIAL